MPSQQLVCVVPADVWRLPMDSATPGSHGDSKSVSGTASPRREHEDAAPAPVWPQHPAQQLLPPQGGPLPVGVQAGVQHGAAGDAAQQAVVAAVLQAALGGGARDLAQAPHVEHGALAWPLQGDIPPAEAPPPRDISAGSCGGDVSRDGGAGATTEATVSKPAPARRGQRSRGRAPAGRRPGVRSAPSSLHGGRGDAPPRPAGDRSPPPRRARRRSAQPSSLLPAHGGGDDSDSDEERGARRGKTRRR